MGALVALEPLLRGGRVWRGTPQRLPELGEPTGHAPLDAVLPTGGWPRAALSEIAVTRDGIGELRMLLPTLARLTRAQREVAVVAPPYAIYPAGWRAAGVDLAHLHVIAPRVPRDVAWATEQCLRSGSLAAVVVWPGAIDERALRRLHVACETGQALGLCLRDARVASSPSPAALRLLMEPGQIRVLKCRGGTPATRPVPVPDPWHGHGVG